MTAFKTRNIPVVDLADVLKQLDHEFGTTLVGRISDSWISFGENLDTLMKVSDLIEFIEELRDDYQADTDMLPAGVGDVLDALHALPDFVAIAIGS
jgi:hypothetical protein